MIDSSALLKDLRGQLKVLQADLRERADDPDNAWGQGLRREHQRALTAERTARSWVEWRDGEVDQAAVAWLVATTFVRFCEDNDLLAGATLDGRPVPVGWIAGPGDRTQRAEENLGAYVRTNPLHSRRHWLQQSFTVLAAQPAGAALVDRRHNPVWEAEISSEAATALIAFWRRTDGHGTLIHDFTDPDLGTRFLGDLYQDLSDYAKKTYALLQTPEFVEEFILDRTLTPAMHETPLDELKLIDPTCGSGHFLLGAFARIHQAWLDEAPAMDAKERVRRAMESIHGVDINAFAVAIARFRLTVAGLVAAKESSLVGVPALGFHLAIGDSLLGEQGGESQLTDTLDLGEGDFEKHTEDLSEYVGILRPGRYHVVVGNPPYITVSDRALNDLYRRAYRTTHREYAMSVPFMELFFRLAIRGHQGTPAGRVGQITSNAFMKQEYGIKLVNEFLAGYHIDNPVDLIDVIDASGAYIPGHGTPTVIVIGRRRLPVAKTVNVVRRVRGEPGRPVDPARGRVWSELVDVVDRGSHDGVYLNVVALDRAVLGKHPWMLASGAYEGFQRIEAASTRTLGGVADTLGYTGQTNSDGVFLAPRRALVRRGVEGAVMRAFVTGDDVRDYAINDGDWSIFPYANRALVPIEEYLGMLHWMWPSRSATWARATFAKRTYKEEGRPWWEWHQVSLDRVGGLSLSYPRVATGQHFSLDRDARVFNREAAFVKLGPLASEEQYLELLGVLNSSTACFWLKQVSHNKGNGGIGGGIGDEDWEPRYEFTGTKLQHFPLPPTLPSCRARELDRLARELSATSPSSVVALWVSSGSDGSLTDLLSSAERDSVLVRARMIFEQEELDWQAYGLYGLVECDLTYEGAAVETLGLGQRAFEIALARRVAEGTEETAWFERHGSTPTIDLPADWPEDYRALVERRLDLISLDRGIRLLEKPEFKRRWASTPWSKQRDEALSAAILDRLEQPELWQDPQGPVTRTVSELAHELRNDEVLAELVRAYTGQADPELVTVLNKLVADQAVPYLAGHRYKPSGLEKFREWQKVWDLQRREDAGERVQIPVPPKYSTPDFRKVSYWQARGKLDVPKERFILYPDARHEGDPTPVLGWAGWSHRDQALALARETIAQQSLGPDEALVPLVAGLVELEPWVRQWHSELEPQFGTSAAEVVTGQIDQLLATLEMTRDQVTAWTPAPARRGRKAATA